MPEVVGVRVLEQHREDSGHQQQPANDDEYEVQSFVEDLDQGHDQFRNASDHQKITEESEPAHNHDSNYVIIEFLLLERVYDLTRGYRSYDVEANYVEC